MVYRTRDNVCLYAHSAEKFSTTLVLHVLCVLTHLTLSQVRFLPSAGCDHLN